MDKFTQGNMPKAPVAAAQMPENNNYGISDSDIERGYTDAIFPNPIEERDTVMSNAQYVAEEENKGVGFVGRAHGWER